MSEKLDYLYAEIDHAENESLYSSEDRIAKATIAVAKCLAEIYRLMEEQSQGDKDE